MMAVEQPPHAMVHAFVGVGWTALLDLEAGTAQNYLVAWKAVYHHRQLRICCLPICTWCLAAMC